MMAYAIFSVLFVIWKESYYSLIYAGIASTFCGVVATYVRLPWRPQFNFEFARIKPMISFGLILLAGTGLFALREHGMIFIVSATKHADNLGYLNRGFAFSMALALQAMGIFWRVAYPHYARVHLNGGDASRDAVVAYRGLLALGLPAAILLACYSTPIINLLLGEKWQPVGQVWGWLVIAGALMLANAPLEAALQAVRHETLQITIAAFTTFLSITIAWFLLHVYGIAGAGMAACVGHLTASILLVIVHCGKNSQLRTASCT